MAERPINTVVDLLDLRSRVTTDDQETFQVRSEVRIGRPELDSPVGTITTRRVYLQLELDGYQIRPGNRLGEPVKAGYVEDTKLVTEKSSSASAGAKAEASLSLSGGSIGAKAAVGADVKTKLQTTVKTKTERGYLKAIGGDRWVISNIENNQQLEEATYITDSDVLCRLERINGANRSAVRISGYILKRDIDFLAKNKMIDPLNWNKKQAIKAFLSKRIGSAAADENERLIISEQEIVNE